MELRAMHRELADRPVEIDVGNPPAALILAQKVVEPRHIALRFDDPSFHYNICAERPFTGDLQLLARISVELICVGGGHIMTKGRDQLLLLGGGKARPGGANREAGRGARRGNRRSLGTRAAAGRSPLLRWSYLDRRHLELFSVVAWAATAIAPLPLIWVLVGTLALLFALRLYQQLQKPPPGQRSP